MRRVTVSITALGLLAAASLALTGCPGSSGDSTVIKIVSSLPRTGSARKQTTTIVNGIQMALDEVGGKVGTYRIVYEDMDDATASAGQWTAEVETANAKRAAADPDVMAYIGTFNSGAAKFSMPILNRAGLLMVSPANTAVELTKPGLGEPNEPGVYRPSGKVTYFRIVPADDIQGPLSADWAKEMGIESVYVIDDKQVYGRGLARLFAERCREIGIEVLGHESIDDQAQEFRSLMTMVKGLSPDLVYFGGTTQTKAGQIAKDLVASGMDAKLMVPDGCFEEAFIESAGAENLNDRCYVTFGGMPPSELTGEGAEFVKRYRAKYNSDPEAYAVYGYEAAKVALEAIRRAGTKDRAAVVAACAAIRDFEGALGAWSFDENGDTTLVAASGNIVRDGVFRFVKSLSQPAGEAEAVADATTADEVTSDEEEPTE